MISVEIGLNGKGLIKSLQMKGHAGIGFRGSDPVCGAVSSLVSTYNHLISSVSDIEAESRWEERGEITIVNIGWSSELDSWYKGISDFFIQGILDIEKDSPQAVNIQFV